MLPAANTMESLGEPPHIRRPTSIGLGKTTDHYAQLRQLESRADARSRQPPPAVTLLATRARFCKRAALRRMEHSNDRMPSKSRASRGSTLRLCASVLHGKMRQRSARSAQLTRLMITRWSVQLTLGVSRESRRLRPAATLLSKRRLRARLAPRRRTPAFGSATGTRSRRTLRAP